MELREILQGGARKADRAGAFTLIELLVVITVIAILMALLFPAFKGVQDQAKRTQAKNDVTQIVTAVNAFYTEYGRYPTTATTDADARFGPGSASTNDALLNELRAVVFTLNSRKIVFIIPPDAKNQTTPRSGIQTSTGQYFDPWGTPYAIALDGDYDSQLPNPYSSNAGSTPLRSGVISWSLGKDISGGSGDKKVDPNEDDVISWQ
ncbi:MAG: prepilin-type N-terminal cleavage/methylation domain-containing protein [Spartobacteria bacterium]